MRMEESKVPKKIRKEAINLFKSLNLKYDRVATEKDRIRFVGIKIPDSKLKQFEKFLKESLSDKDEKKVRIEVGTSRCFPFKESLYLIYGKN